MGIVIVGHRVLVKPFTVEQVDETIKNARAAGILIVDNDDAKLRQNAVDRGIVVGIGSTAYKDFGGEPWVVVGDSVYYSRYAGKWITNPDTEDELLALNDEDIIAVYKGD